MYPSGDAPDVAQIHIGYFLSWSAENSLQDTPREDKSVNNCLQAFDKADAQAALSWGAFSPRVVLQTRHCTSPLWVLSTLFFRIGGIKLRTPVSDTLLPKCALTAPAKACNGAPKASPLTFKREPSWLICPRL